MDVGPSSPRKPSASIAAEINMQRWGLSSQQSVLRRQIRHKICNRVESHALARLQLGHGLHRGFVGLVPGRRQLRFGRAHDAPLG